MSPSSAPLASNSAPDAGQQAGVSGVPSKSETQSQACPKAHRKPSISQVILGVLEDKGARSHVSLATLKKALTTTGYNMTRNAWRFKKVLKRLVENGMLKQVTSKGPSGSFCMGKNHASKFKLKAKKRGQRKERRQQKRRFLPRSKKGHKRLMKRGRRAAKRHRNY